MKKILFIFAMIITLTGCDSPTYRGRQMYKSYFKKTLKDPESFKVYSEKYTEEDVGKTIIWTIDYGARNSYGGMVRKTETIKTFYGGQGIGSLFINGEHYSYRELK